MNSLKTITELNGKKLGKAHLNLLARLEEKFHVKLPDASQIRVNDYTGVSCQLCPLAVALFDFIIINFRSGLVKGSSMASLTNPRAIPTSVWDSARHFFATYWPDEYYKLID